MSGFGTMIDPPVVFIVDDDEAVRDSLSGLVLSRRWYPVDFVSAEAFKMKVDEFMKEASAQSLPRRCCLVLDVRMPGMNGIQLFDWLLELGLTKRMPVIFFTGHGDVPTAVNAVQRGAFDYVEKPQADNNLLDRIQAAFEAGEAEVDRFKQQKHVRDTWAKLTTQERAVTKLVLDGATNKVASQELGIALRTAEHYREAAFYKLGVKSVSELARLLHGSPLYSELRDK